MVGGKQGNIYLLDRRTLPGKLDRRPACSTDSSTDASLLAPDAMSLKLLWKSAPGQLHASGKYNEPVIARGTVFVQHSSTKPKYDLSTGNVKPARPQDDCIRFFDALVRSRNLDFGELLTRLSRDELKTICDEFWLASDGREKQPLIERIPPVRPLPCRAARQRCLRSTAKGPK